ncbi:glycosyltransferase [Flavobacterium chilense]|uniref:Glycosyltransferase involved in cell wall bisynthesis n=1 Tax=Flavobacterium chilense TaxID=946677 RepID=A0A1M6YGR4_9FLAO|nr:glycosyltransferase [Flavobacterium chilense]SHL17189.1 Glycosyltransferase involved in cell wall bisynthesis [Flavobacterium chilense]
MRLVHFTASKVWRGHEQMIIDIFESLRDNSSVNEQLIICPKDSEIFKVATQKKLEVLGLDFKSEYSLGFAKNFKKEIEKFDPAVLFLHNSKAHTTAVLSSVFFGLKVPMVLFRTLIKNVGTNFFRKYKYNYKLIRKIVCISDPVAEILKLSVKDHTKLTVIGSVVDTDKFVNNAKNGFLHQEFNIPLDHKIVGNVSAFCKVKDHFTWVNTVEELYKRGLKAKYVLIGEGSMEQEIKDYVSSKGLENEIIFAGFRKDIQKCLPELDLFLFTSKNEATGGVILESYACKVPVVAAKAGGIPTVLLDNETGLLAEVGNAIDFADKVETLIDDELMKEKFIQKGYDFLMSTSTRLIIGSKVFAVANDVVVNEVPNNVVVYNAF